MKEKVWKTQNIYSYIFMILVFGASILVFSCIGYSDGDDQFFLDCSRNMGLLEYLTWRYETWTGRLASEAMMYLVFRVDLWVWRMINAVMIVALPLLLVAIKNVVTGITEYNAQKKWLTEGFLSIIIAVWFYLLMDIKTFGYSCIWITGTMNYLWADVFGAIALYAVAMNMYEPERNISKLYMISIPSSVICTMCPEQTGAVVLAFELICIGVNVWKKVALQKGLIFQTIATIATYLLSSMSPGNELRVTESIAMYLPQFEELGFFGRIFYTVQWLISSFANENATLLIVIWAVCLFIIRQKIKKHNAEAISCSKWYMHFIFTSVFLIVAVLSKVGVLKVHDIGLELSNMTGLINAVPTLESLTVNQWFHMIWWILAMVYTLILLLVVCEKSIIAFFLYMGAIASEAIMIFSPTIYASGERLFFMTGVLFLFIVLLLFHQLYKEEQKQGIIFVGLFVLVGLLNFGLQTPELLGVLG